MVHLRPSAPRVPAILIFVVKSFCNMSLPKDPMILYSMVNMKLRDLYSSLDELCDDLQIDRSELESRLHEAGFDYDAGQNRFI